MILILTPVYKAWPMVVKMCKAIDANTSNPFHHILCLDSCDMPPEVYEEITKNPNREVISYHDGLEAAAHRPCITKALQTAWEWHGEVKYENLFVVETDIMVPLDWDKTMLNLSHLIPDWVTLDALPVDEAGNTTYPARDHNIRRRHEVFGGHNFEVVQYGDWNCILFNSWIFGNLEGGGWRFDDVPSHHDILLSRNWREKRGLDRENWDPALFYRTDEVKVVHYANSSRSELPEGLNTPSNPK